MKKLVLMLTVIAFGATASYAQGRFSVGAELALPQGDWNDIAATGFGGSVRYESPINENLSWTGSIGYLSFGEKDKSGVKTSMIPVLAGAKYYFNESFNGFYAGAELGMVFGKAKFDDELAAFIGEDSETSNDFAFAPQVGYHLSNIDISARYLIVEDANSIGIRIAYVFGGK